MSRHGAALRMFAAFAVLVNGLFPAIWMLLTSLRSESELTRTPITYLPAAPTLANYARAFNDQPLLRYLANSLIVASASTALTLLVSVMAAYALARLEISFRDLALAAIIAVSTFPLVTLLVPLFQTLRALGLLNSYPALVLPHTVLSLPICTLVLVSFFESIPQDLENAAMVDGSTRVGALTHILLPLSAPGVATAGILAFVNSWDEFLLALSFELESGVPNAAGGDHVVPGRILVSLAGDLGRAGGRDRAGNAADHPVPAAYPGRADGGRGKGIGACRSRPKPAGSRSSWPERR